MILLEDSRQKIGKHNLKAEWFKEHGIEVMRSKLFVGDYQIASEGGRVVDTKENVMELIGDLHGEHERFRNECIRAKDAGIELLVLIEEYPPEGNICKWKSPRWKYGKKRGLPMTFTKPESIQKAMDTMTAKYGVKFAFISKEDSAKEIMKYLKGEAEND